LGPCDDPKISSNGSSIEEVFLAVEFGTNSWQYLFRKQMTRLLEIVKCLFEGHPIGILDVVNIFLRTEHWPNVTLASLIVIAGRGKKSGKGGIVSQV